MQSPFDFKGITMRSAYSYLFLLLIFCIYACRKDNKLTVLNIKGACILTSDTSEISGNHAYSSYEFQANSNRLQVAKKVTGNAGMVNYCEIYYHPNNLPKHTITFVNAHQYFETKFFYINGSSLPYKTERYYTNRQENKPAKRLSSLQFQYDTRKRLTEVIFDTEKNGKEYSLRILYNEEDNVTNLQHIRMKGAQGSDTLITVVAYDKYSNPYSSIAYWKFLMLNEEWDTDAPEPLITALSRNNPLVCYIGKIRREMSYTYNQAGLPATRFNIYKHQGSHHSFKESFTYRCP